MPSDALKAKLKQSQELHSEPSRIRLHRAISWLARSEKETGDSDAQIIFLWIAFNAAYARLFGFEKTEREQLQLFIETLVSSDKEKRLQKSLFEQFSGPIRVLIENKFVFEPFWRDLREHDDSGRWQLQFEESKKLALRAVMANQTEIVLTIVFDRLYVLRNQLIHGGATWNSKVNRSQIHDAVKILNSLIPIIIDLMLDHPDLEFGETLYPVVG